MKEMILSIGNLIDFVSLQSPLFIGSFLLFSSILEFNPKGFIWAAAVSACMTGGQLIKRMGFIPEYEDGDPVLLRRRMGGCGIFTDPESWLSNKKKFFSPRAIFHAFTFTYILLGSIDSIKDGKLTGHTLPLGIVIGIIGLSDMFFRVKNHCDGPLDVLTGSLFGIVGAIASYYAVILLFRRDGKRYTYADVPYTDGGSKKCKVEKNTKFICKSGV